MKSRIKIDTAEFVFSGIFCSFKNLDKNTEMWYNNK